MTHTIDIPLSRPGAEYAEFRAEIDAAIARVLASGRFVKGPEATEFEREFAAYTGAAHAVGVGNGTDALALALAASGVGRGDEVIVPAMTFVATAEAILLCGAAPRFVDVTESALQLDAAAVESAVNERTRAIVPVHLYGYPAPLGEIARLASSRGLAVIEDAAQAHGARIGGRHAGTFGKAGAFSLFPAKSLGAFGDAGVVVTDDADLAACVRHLADHGRGGITASADLAGFAHLPGSNSRLDEMQAAILRAKLARLPEWIEKRRRIEATYRERLAGTGDLLFLDSPPGAETAPLNVVIRAARRDALASHLATHGIEAKPHYPVAVHQVEAYRRYAEGASFPVAERAAATLLSLPNHPSMTEEEVDRVVKGVAAFFLMSGRRSRRRATRHP